MGQSKPQTSRAFTREELMEQYLAGVGKGSTPGTSRLSTIESKPRASRALTPEDLYKQYLTGTEKDPSSCQQIPEIVVTPSMDVTRRSSSATAATSSDSSTSSTSSRNSTVTRKPTLPTKPTFDWGSPALTVKEKKKALRKKKGKKRRRIGRKAKPNYLRGTTTSQGRKRKSRGARAITLGSQLRFKG